MNRRTSTLLSIGISAILVAAAIWFLYDHHGDIWTPGPWRMPHGMTGGSGMAVMALLFWGLVPVALVLLVAAVWAGRRSAYCEDPLAILKRRYARGEIDKHRFDAMRRDLQARKTRNAR